jgi:hypothetical protein
MGKRFLWFRGILWRGWRRPITIIFALIGVYDTAMAQFFLDSVMQPVASYIPYLQFWHWWIILLLFLVVMIFEGSYRLNIAMVQRTKDEQRIIHSDSASRLFAIDVSDCKVDGGQIIELSLMLTITAFPSLAIEGIYLKLHGDKYKESTGAFIKGGETLFQNSPTFGLGVRFELQSNFRKGNYNAQIIVYVDGREETQDFKFEYY